MILVWFILILMLGGIFAWIAARWSVAAARWISLAAVLINFIIAVSLWLSNPGPTGSSTWITTFNAAWIPSFGINFSLALDGLSLLMLLLTFLLGIAAILASWNEIEYRPGLFHFNVL